MVADIRIEIRLYQICILIFPAKYLIAGHTQMERDSKHNTIERKLCCDIYTPRDYVMLFHSARQQPSPYHVVHITFDEIQRISGSYITSIRPGRKAGEPTVHQLRALKYAKSNTSLGSQTESCSKSYQRGLTYQLSYLHQYKCLTICSTLF